MFGFGGSSKDNKKSDSNKDKKGNPEDKVCEMCVDFITKASAGILMYENELKKNSGKICDAVTLGNKELDSKCRQTLDESVAEMVKMVRDSKSPKDICIKFKLCSDK